MQDNDNEKNFNNKKIEENNQNFNIDDLPPEIKELFEEIEKQTDNKKNVKIIWKKPITKIIWLELIISIIVGSAIILAVNGYFPIIKSAHWYDSLIFVLIFTVIDWCFKLLIFKFGQKLLLYTFTLILPFISILSMAIAYISVYILFDFVITKIGIGILCALIFLFVRSVLTNYLKGKLLK